jgi:hypothetical protein
MSPNTPRSELSRAELPQEAPDLKPWASGVERNRLGRGMTAGNAFVGRCERVSGFLGRFHCLQTGADPSGPDRSNLAFALWWV